MNLKEYKEKLKKHDWYYAMSDSRSVFEDGQKEEENLKNLAVGKKTYIVAFNRAWKKTFKKKKIVFK